MPAMRLRTCVNKHTALFALAVVALGACATVSDAEFTRSFCEGRGLEAGPAQFEQCVSSKQTEMDRNRAVQRSFRYSP